MIRDQNGDLALPGVEGQLRRVGENYCALFNAFFQWVQYGKRQTPRFKSLLLNAFLQTAQDVMKELCLHKLTSGDKC